MNIKRLSQFALALFLPFLSIASYADSTSEVLLGLNLTPKALDILVASGGCTQKEDFKIDVNKGVTEKPPYSITIYRTKSDDCKVFLPDGVLLSFTKEELGLNGLTEFTVTNRFGNTSQHRTVGAQPYGNNLKKACLDATVQAINMEILRYQAWLKNATDPKAKAKNEKELVRLAEEKQKYLYMASTDYELPQKLSLTGQYADGQILFFYGQSKSGPFYHVAASAVPLIEGKKYSFDFYVVYPRSYQFPNYYVYVAKSEQKDF